MKKKLLFVITQFYRGGAENTLLNLFKQLSFDQFEIDFLILNQNDKKRPTNLIPFIPEYINVIDFIKITGKKVWIGDTKQLKKANKMISNGYDFAFHIGEWWSPEFVAKYVTSKIKAMWLHTDLNLNLNIAKYEIEQFSYYFNSFIFVSKGSMENSIKLFPFMSRNSIIIHNLIDTEEIKLKSNEYLLPEDTNYFNTNLPVLLTVANIRPEKRHLRCLKAMKILKDKGIVFFWLNAGVKSDPVVLNQLEKEIKEYGLENNFILLGPRTNPYPLIKKADAVAVCSHVESWSLVITEALSLGIPVIATPTSGALEQLQNGKNGFISDGFEAEDIADNIEKYFYEKEKLSVSSSYDINKGVNDFIEFIDNTKPKKSIIYFIEDLNYVGGAHKATFLQINNLKKYYDISILSLTDPKNELLNNELSGVCFFNINNFDNRLYLNLSTKEILKGNYSNKQKFFRLFIYLLKLIKLDNIIKKKFLLSKKFAFFIEKFDNFISMSESSSLRDLFINLKKPKKIQWIHQNYKYFYSWSILTKEITSCDAELYRYYDKIVNLSKICRKDFIDIHPHLSEKALAIRNYSPVITNEKITNTIKIVDNNYFNIITIMRLDEQKNVFGYLTIAKLLKNSGIKFHWYVAGDGPLKRKLLHYIKIHDLNDCLILCGNVINPYPLLKQCDLFVLFSFYEGTPVTIEEAQILQVPVIARKLGGIPDQIEDGVTGWLVDGDETDCFIKIKELIDNSDLLKQMRDNLSKKETQDEEVTRQLLELLG